MMSKQHPGHTKSLLTYALLLFLIFDGTALGLNFWLTKRIQSQTIELNLAGRQRMLSQKMVKEFLYAPPGATQASQLAVLNKTVTLFDRTLSAFRNGGTTLDTHNTLVSISAFQTRPYFNLVEQGWNTWLPLRKSVLRYVRSPSPSAYVALNQDLKAQSDLLLDHMNELTLAIEQQARYETGQIRFFQAVALLLGMINFAVIYWLYRKRLNSIEKGQSLVDSLLNDLPSAVAFTDESGRIFKTNQAFNELLALDFKTLRRHQMNELLVPIDKHSNCYQLSQHALHQTLVQVTTSDAMDNDQPITLWRFATIQDHAKQDTTSTTPIEMPPYKALAPCDSLEVPLAELAKSSDTHALHALMIVDLHHLNPTPARLSEDVHSSISHEMGWRLKPFSSVEQTVTHQDDNAFIVLLQHITGTEQALACAQDIIESLTAPYYIEQETFYLDACVGIVTFESQSATAPNLIQQAEHALHLAKQRPDRSNIQCLAFA